MFKLPFVKQSIKPNPPNKKQSGYQSTGFISCGNGCVFMTPEKLEETERLAVDALRKERKRRRKLKRIRYRNRK